FCTASTLAFIALIACSASSCADSFSTRTWPHSVGGNSSSSSALSGSPFLSSSLRSSDITRPASFLPASNFLSLRRVSWRMIRTSSASSCLRRSASSTSISWVRSSFDTPRHAQAGVADLAGLFAEDGAQQFLFGRKLGLALGGYLADQDVLRADFGADADDAAGVEVLERLFADVGNVAGDLLGSELGVARDAFVFLDMHRGEQVFLDHPLGDQDRILEVVTAPRHERDQHVAAQRQLAHVGGRSVGQHVARLDALALDHDGALVDAGVLIGALILDQIVDIDAGVAQVLGLLVGAHDYPFGIDAFDGAVALADHRNARIAAYRALQAGADQRRVGLQQRNGLALHVRSHQGAVGVVVFKKRDQGRGHRDELVGRHVHVLDVLGADHGGLTADARGDEVGGEAAVRVELRVGLRDHLVFLVEGGQIDDSIGDAIVFDFAVRRLDKAVFVDARVGRERRDKSDIGAFGRFNRADAAVMGRVNVADLESGALAGQTARSKRGQPALVRDLAERIGLIHELRQLRGAEELLDHGRSRLVVDQLLRHQGLDILQAHPLFYRALHPHQPDAELVLDQLSDCAHAAIAEMVDIVNLAVAVLELHQVADDFEDVFAAQRALLERHVNLELVIELQAPDFRQVVALGVEEQVVEEGGRRFLGRRIAGTQAPVDLDHG